MFMGLIPNVISQDEPTVLNAFVPYKIDDHTKRVIQINLMNNNVRNYSYRASLDELLKNPNVTQR